MIKKILFLLTLFVWLGLWLNYSFWDEEQNLECSSLFWSSFLWNSSCPILEDKCNEASPCKDWFVCWKSWYCEADNNIVQLWDKCSNKNIKSWIFWNAVCDTCPCKNNFDFNTWLRECDVIVPVITNREWNKILDIWDYYQIK